MLNRTRNMVSKREFEISLLITLFFFIQYLVFPFKYLECAPTNDCYFEPQKSLFNEESEKNDAQSETGHLGSTVRIIVDSFAIIGGIGAGILFITKRKRFKIKCQLEDYETNDVKYSVFEVLVINKGKNKRTLKDLILMNQDSQRVELYMNGLPSMIESDDTFIAKPVKLDDLRSGVQSIRALDERKKEYKAARRVIKNINTRLSDHFAQEIFRK